MNLNLNLGGKDLDTSSIQRAEHLSSDRCGRFTGSSVKNLMGTPAAFQKYVFQKAMERITGVEIAGASTADMRWGNENEERVLESFSEETGIEYSHVGFKHIPEYMLGCTPDALFHDEVIGEIKSPTSWNGYYDRLAKPWNEKHIDFWQVQTEMLVMNLSKARYIVTLPYQFEHKHQSINIIEASVKHQDMIKKQCDKANRIIERFVECGDFEGSL